MPYSHITLQAITYRIIVIILDAIVLYFFLDNALDISLIVIARHAIQTGMYWLHEAGWAHTQWGITAHGVSHARTILKTITFRVLASSKDLLVIYVFTENIVVAAEGTLVISIVNTIAYYLHDRYWGAWQAKPVSAGQ